MRVGIFATLPLLFLAGSCGNTGSPPTNPNPAGSYEFIVTSNVTGAVTLVEANLSSTANQSSARGPSEVQILSLESKVWYVNGVCPGNTPGQNSVAITSAGNNLSLTFNEGGDTFGGPGVVTGTTVNANYAVSGSSCQNLKGIIGFPPGTDSGGIVGNQAPNLKGNFAGTLNLPSGTDDALLTLAEAPDHSLNVTAVLTGVDNGTFSLQGSAVGNIIFASGPVGGNTLTLFGYYDRAGVYTKMPNSLLIFDYDTAASAGLLLGQ